MKTGYLYNKTKDEIIEDSNNGIDITLGVDVYNIIDTITYFEIISNNDSNKTLALLKKELFTIMGKIKEDENN